jgi:hypothetical protein
VEIENYKEGGDKKFRERNSEPKVAVSSRERSNSGNPEYFE